MNHAIKAIAHEIKIRRVAYFYSAAERRSRGALWPSFAPALIVSTLLKDYPAFVSQVCQFERDLGTQDVISRDDNMKWRLRQLGHCQLRILRRVRDERQVEIGAQEIMGQIGR